MTDKELRKLKREELLEMLISQSKEVSELRAQVDELEKKLNDRQICLEKAGSIAEASVLLNGVFEAAQAAAQQYLENIQLLSGQQEQICEEMAKRTKERCEELEKRTKEHCEELEKRTKERCDAMKQEAAESASKRWDEISRRLESFYNEHKGLRELLKVTGESTEEK